MIFDCATVDPEVRIKCCLYCHDEWGGCLEFWGGRELQVCCNVQFKISLLRKNLGRKVVVLPKLA